MIHSNIFRSAHNLAKQRRDIFPTYSGAFSFALRFLYAERRASILKAANEKVAATFRSNPLTDATFVGFTSLKGCDVVRAVWTNSRVFYIEGNEYDFECDQVGRLNEFLKSETVGILGAAKHRPVHKIKADPVVIGKVVTEIPAWVPPVVETGYTGFTQQYFM